MKSNNLKLMFAVLAGLSLLALPAVGQKQNPGPPSPPTQNVLVVNGAGQPVPTAPQGTTNVAGTVNVGNTPSVTVANTPSVSISGTPTVALSPGGSVGVTNLLDAQNNPNPLAVLEAIQPYEDGCAISISSTNAGSCNFSQIPAGKRLIIEEFDANSFMDPGIKPIQLSLGNSGFLVHYFPAMFMGNNGGADYFTTHQTTRLYAPAGYQPACYLTLSSSAQSASSFCRFSGFLVDVQ
jgi:hypothetical protein